MAIAKPEKPFTICIGSLIYGQHHSEKQVATRKEAVAWLHAYDRKAVPEPAIADVGDFRSWIGNRNYRHINLRKSDFILDLIETYVRQENAFDAACAIEDNDHCPDIQIVPVKEGVVRITSIAMNCDYVVTTNKVSESVFSLIHQYQDLIAAETIPAPKQEDAA